MPLRIAEYAIGIYRQFRQLPVQIVVYVGEAPLRMPAVLYGPDPADPNFSFRFTLIDFRNLDGNALLTSDRIEDNVLAILTRLQDRTAVVRQTLERIAALEEPARSATLARFLIISGLRRMASAVQEEIQRMPVLNDILSHGVIGPAILQGQQEIIRRQLEKRFGALPDWAESRLSSLSGSELDDLAVRLLDTPRLEDLFPAR